MKIDVKFDFHAWCSHHLSWRVVYLVSLSGL